MTEKKNHSARSNDLRKRAEEKARAHAASTRDALSPEETRRMIHELQVHQIELEMQNEELRRTQEELEASQSCYFELYDLAPVGYLTLNTQGLIEKANLTATTMLGVASGSLVRQPLSRFILPEDRNNYTLLCNHFHESGARQSIELRMVCADGSTFWAWLQAATEKPGECRITLSDITEFKRADEELRESTRHIHYLADSAPVLMWMSGPDMRGTYFNQHWLDFTGRSLEQELGTGWAEGIHPDDYQGCFDTYLASFTAQRKFSMEYRVRRADGEYRWLMDNGAPSFSADGSCAGYVRLCTDVTLRKQAEEALNSSRRLFRTLAQVAPVGIFRTDRHGNYLYVNELWQKMAGVTEREALGAGWVQAIHPDDRILVADQWYHCAQEKLPFKMEYRFQRPDGAVTWVQGQALSKVGADGQTISYVGTITDITERKQMEQALKENEGLLKLVIDAVPALISYVDTECRYRMVNRGYEKLFGASDEAIRGRHVGEVIGEALWAATRPFEERVLAGDEASFELSIPDPAGTKRTFQAYYTPDRHADGSVRGYVALAQDISEQKETELTLRSYSRRLIELEEELRKMLAAELHDEFGPDLTALNFNLALIGDGLTPKSVRHLVPRIEDAGRLLEGMSHKVRTIIARLRPAVLEDYGLEVALRRYTSEMESRTNITTVMQSEEPIPRLSPDKELALFRIAQEALTNAAKYSRAKNVTVTLGSTDTTIRLSVCDDGAGFVKPGVLQPGAAGWGLAIMRERTEMMGGRFLLETAPGTGVRIYLEIPKEKSDGDQRTAC